MGITSFNNVARTTTNKTCLGKQRMCVFYIYIV
jgi:hypothetical protein